MVSLDSLFTTDENTYQFDMFFAERHTTQSVVEIIVDNLILIPEPSAC